MVSSLHTWLRAEAAAPAGDRIAIGRPLLILWAGRHLIVAITLAALLLGALHAWLVATPRYTATSVLLYAPEDTAPGDRIDPTRIRTEVAVLTARHLVADVADTLALAADPEFNPALTDPIPTRLAMAFSEAFGLTEATAAPVTAAAPDVTDAVLDRVWVRNLPETRVLEITAQGDDPATAARIADALAETYLRDRSERRRQAQQRHTERIALLKADVTRAEATLSRFTARHGPVTDAALAALDRRHSLLRDRLSTARAEERRATRRLAAMEAASDQAARAAVAHDPTLDRLLHALAPTAARQFDRRFRLLRDRTARNARHATERLTALRTAAERLAEDIETRRALVQSHEQLTLDLEAARLLHAAAVDRLRERTASDAPWTRLLSPAATPTAPDGPQRGLFLAMSGILGLTLSTGLVLARNGLDLRVISPTELTGITGLPLAGQLPEAPTDDPLALLDALDPDAIRNLHAAVMERRPDLIVTTGTGPATGTTAATLALAQSLAESGHGVLVLDSGGDGLASFLPGLPDAGWQDVLSGALPLDAAISHAPGFAPDILRAGPAAATDTLTAPQFRALLTDLRERYDVLLIDTPPVAQRADARLLAPLADTILLTVRCNATTRPDLATAAGHLPATTRLVLTRTLATLNRPRLNSMASGMRQDRAVLTAVTASSFAE